MCNEIHYFFYHSPFAGTVEEATRMDKHENAEKEELEQLREKNDRLKRKCNALKTLLKRQKRGHEAKLAKNKEELSTVKEELLIKTNEYHAKQQEIYLGLDRMQTLVGQTMLAGFRSVSSELERSYKETLRNVTDEAMFMIFKPAPGSVVQVSKP